MFRKTNCQHQGAMMSMFAMTQACSTLLDDTRFPDYRPESAFIFAL